MTIRQQRMEEIAQEMDFCEQAGAYNEFLVLDDEYDLLVAQEIEEDIAEARKRGLM